MHAFWQDNSEITLSRQPRDILVFFSDWHRGYVLLGLVTIKLHVCNITIYHFNFTPVAPELNVIVQALKRTTCSASSADNQ